MVVEVHGTFDSCCIVHRLNTSPLVLDHAVSAASVLVRYRESNDVQLGPKVELWEDETEKAQQSNSYTTLRLGHQHSSSCSCPITADDGILPFAAPRLAAVALAMDEQNRILLTRRPESMRTFPGAWVLPGGGVDVSDGTVVSAACRELEEETGLRPSQLPLEPFCAWESCFPTSVHEWSAQRAKGGRTSHHLIVYFVIPVSSGQLLKLNPDECECAAWVPLEDVAKLSEADDEMLADETFPLAVPANGHMPARSLAGVYPNSVGSGIGRGHMWAIRQMQVQMQI